MNDRVVSDRFPYIPLTVTIRDRPEELEALLDTGFTGHLIVPAGFLHDGHPADGSTILALADGRRIRAPSYHGTIQIGQAPPIEALITELGDEPIVGRRVAGQFRIILEHGQRVIVEP